MTGEKKSGWLGEMTKEFRRKFTRDRCDLEARIRRGRRISEVGLGEFQVFSVHPSHHQGHHITTFSELSTECELGSQV